MQFFIRNPSPSSSCRRVPHRCTGRYGGCLRCHLQAGGDHPGGVVVGIKTKGEAKSAFTRIITSAQHYDPKALLEGVLVQKMAALGDEVILGMNRYAAGPLIMFGLGGIFVEIFKDVVFRLAPIDRDEAHRMVREIKGYRLFTGFRGRPKGDVNRLEENMVRLSLMVVNHPEIIEMDINPLLVHREGRGATVADCRIILKPLQDQ